MAKSKLGFFPGRGVWAVVLKEMTNIFRDRQLITTIVLVPVFFVMFYGFALNPSVEQVSLGIVDYAQSSASRELIATLTTSDVVVTRVQTLAEKNLVRSLLAGKVKVALVIPPEFDRQLSQGNLAEVQVLIDGVDANRVGILRGYLSQIVRQYRYRNHNSPESSLINLQTTILYNPGLVSSWYFVPGVLGVILTAISTFAASSTMTAEKDYGTFEQLLLTPLLPWEVLLGKLLPLLGIILVMVLITNGFSQVVFNLPFRGSWLMFMTSTIVYIVLTSELGLILGLLNQNMLQAFLTTLFINVPLVQLSGAYTPIEAMPPLFQGLTLLDPLRYYIFILRSVIVKGIGFEMLWQPLLLLVIIAVGLFILCLYLFKLQKYHN
ncbi:MULTISPECIES: ABC transporter permease [unclassified Moorena]|uniref:ABC transporter permease n=1 Tax=unclassified Moorena TaxID=2683338 RepID=UPI0013CD6D2D|nr:MULTISPECIES: ABC transporter permease [unclassified Moorena]NEO18195.1 ABC transporter permease [Moorena sp. SIO4A5]NEQ57334.1 ABC transporter permease [Moorena sp. SIO4A1]